MSQVKVKQRSIMVYFLLIFAGVVWMPSAALSAGYSTDIEMVHPTFGHEAFSAVDVPATNTPGTVRWGSYFQYTRNPMMLFDAVNNQPLGSAVAHRGTAMLGASVDITRGFNMNLLFPLAFNSGYDPDAEEFSADGFGQGDITLGARVIAYRSPNFSVGARVGLTVPSGKKFAYIGDQSVRADLAALLMLEFGGFQAVTNLGIIARGTNDTQVDYIHGSQVSWNTGLRYSLPAAMRTSFTAEVITRAGFFNFLRGGAENTVGMMGGVQVTPIEAVRLDFSAGRGLTQGAGATDLRVLFGITIAHVPKPPPAEIYVEVPPPPPPPPVPVEVEEWEEGELARVIEDRIEIKDMLEFFVDTNDLKPESRPVLEALASLFNQNARIAHVVIEGHASEEGSHIYNYNLSVDRARAIFEALLGEGVPTERMSYRGMGEVVPINLGTEEADLQENRRVEFHIVKELDELEDMPVYDSDMKLPWSGEVTEIIQPPDPKMMVLEEDTSDNDFDSFVPEEETIDFEGDDSSEPDTGVEDEAIDGYNFDTGNDDDSADFNEPESLELDESEYDGHPASDGEELPSAEEVVPEVQEEEV